MAVVQILKEAAVVAEDEGDEEEGGESKMELEDMDQRLLARRTAADFHGSGSSQPNRGRPGARFESSVHETWEKRGGKRTYSQTKKRHLTWGNSSFKAKEKLFVKTSRFGSKQMAGAESFSQTTGDTTYKKKRGFSHKKSFWGGTEYSRSESISKTVKSDNGKKNESMTNEYSKSSRHGVTFRQAKAVKTVKKGVTEIQETSRSLNKSRFMSTYTFEKNNMKAFGNGVMFGSKTSVSVSSSIPSIRKMLESGMTKKAGGNPNLKKSLPAPKPGGLSKGTPKTK